jgi:ABC-type phosphate/phosphonate transport system substrate-binding protein
VAGICSTGSPSIAGEKDVLTIVVMDPLAAPLSCPCVKGYAQRDYDKLGEFLHEELGREVKVVFSESLAGGIEKAGGAPDLVIGKRSVVVAQASGQKLDLTPALALTDKQGETTQTGLIVVPNKDPALSVSGLGGYRIIFGPEDCDEKHSAALTLLKEHGVAAPATIETCAACSDGATVILEAGPDVRAATVISSYAAPLLEGCGTIKKGDLRVVGTTEPVPFVVLFISASLPESEQSLILETLKMVGEEPLLLTAIESQRGFIPEPDAEAADLAESDSKKN